MRRLRIEIFAAMCVALFAIPMANADEYIAVIWADVAVDATGKITDVDIIASLPEPIANVISNKIAAWEFEPAQQDGLPVPSTTAVFTEVTFAENTTGDVSVTVDYVRSGPRPVINPPPEYPDALRGDGVKGSVELQYLVMADGSVNDITIVDSNPEGVFDDIAVAAINSWSFKPKTVNGVPINTPVRQIIEFNP